MDKDQPFDIKPWFPTPTLQRTTRNWMDGSVTSSATLSRSILSSTVFFFLFASMTAFFLGILAGIKYSEFEAISWWKYPFVVLGALGFISALIWATGNCVIVSLAFGSRIRTLMRGSSINPWLIVSTHILFAIIGTLLLYISVEAGLWLFDEMVRAIVASKHSGQFFTTFSVGWMILLAIILVAQVASDIIAMFTFQKAPRPGPLHYMSPGTQNAEIAHLSDLHITASDSTPMVEGRVQSHGPKNGNAALKQHIHENREVLKHADVIIITGDITDSGLSDEWRTFFQIFPEAWLSRTVIVPGNHDLNLTNASNLMLEEGADQYGRKLRATRFIAAMYHCHGNRTYVLSGETKLQPLPEFIAQYHSLLKEFITTPPARTYEDSSIGLHETTSARDQQLLDLPHTLMDELFPCVVELPHSPLRVIVLDSNIEADNILTNAMGRIRPWHLIKLNHIFKQLDQQDVPYVIALHHHLALPRTSSGSFKQMLSKFIACENAAEFAATLQGDKHRLVLHGHRHVKYEGSFGQRIHVISAPSTTLGNQWEQHVEPGYIRPGFSTIDVTWNSQGIGVSKLTDHPIRVNLELIGDKAKRGRRE